MMRPLFDLTPSEARPAASRSAKPWKILLQPAGLRSRLCARNCVRCWKRPECARQAEVVSLLANVTLDRSATEN
jgi:hypothetical protein